MKEELENEKYEPRYPSVYKQVVSIGSYSFLLNRKKLVKRSSRFIIKMILRNMRTMLAKDIPCY